MKSRNDRSSKVVELKLRPAFGSIHQAAGFLGLLLLALGLPWILSILGVDRQVTFLVPPNEDANYAFIRQELYVEQDPIDILLVGPCTVWWQVHADIIKSELEARLGRPATVLNLGFNHFGADLSYLIAKDALARRKVRLLVLATPRPSDESIFPHPNAFLWWNYPADREALSGLKAKDHFLLYSASAMGSFRHLSSLLTTVGLSPELISDLSFGTRERISRESGLPAIEYPRTGLAPQETVFESLDPTRMELDSNPASPETIVLYRAIYAMAAQTGTKVALLSSPLRVDFEGERIRERANWFEELGAGTMLIGVPPVRLLKGLTDQQRQEVFEGGNLSVEASRYFTELITPGILRVYEQSQVLD